MEALQRIMARLNSMGMSFDFVNMTDEEREKHRCDDYNKTPGHENEKDGYDCKLCMNRTDFWIPEQTFDGKWSHATRFCKCRETRASIKRLKKSGLKDIIKDYTFDKFEATEPWQQALKTAAMEYAAQPEGWFFLGGQSGAGKTHLCTAISREFLLEGKRVRYMLWRDDIVRIKNAATDSEQLASLMRQFKNVDVLYIDDLFKTGKSSDGTYQRPTSADINYAFEIINYRYNNPNLLTIISSEWTESELLDIDEAIGGRIYERAKTFSIAKDRSRNYRIRKAVTI